MPKSELRNCSGTGNVLRGDRGSGELLKQERLLEGIAKVRGLQAVKTRGGRILTVLYPLTLPYR